MARRLLRHGSLRRLPPPLLAQTLAVVLALVAQAGASRTALADPVRQVELDTDNTRSAVTVIDHDLKTAIAKERRYPLDRRFIEATMAYERGNTATAAVMLVDLVTNTEFQAGRDYGDALYMLGDCLYRQHNYMGAKRYLDLVLKVPNSKNFQLALQELVDISVRMHKMAEVDVYAQKLVNIMPGQRKAELLYQFGRSFFSAGHYDKARTFLEGVTQGDKRWPNARFYLGALLVAGGKIDEAIVEFAGILGLSKSADPARRPAAEVLDHSHLALGRLYLQQKKFDDAVANYQAVDHNSTVYEEALFEMAATHVAAKRPKAALEALDVLLLTVSDDNVAVQAAVLRGRINMLDKEFDAADAAYQDVVERYSAITGELTRFASSDKNLEQFFSWLLNRGTDEYTVVRPVSERVARYIEKDEDMQRVVSLFDDMGAERADVKESARLAGTIDAALKETSRLDMFPELKDGWLRLIENQNRSVEIGRRIVELLRGYALPSMNAEERTKADALEAQRKKWEVAFAKVPATKGDYVLRQNRVDAGYQNLAADVGILKSQLASVKDQVLAVEKMLNERIYGEQGIALTKEHEAELRASLQNEKDELRRTYRAIEELSQDTEVYAQGVGAGDKVSNDEATVRAALLAAQRVEQAMYVSVLERGAGHQDDVSRLSMARNTLDKLGGQIMGILQVIAGRAGERVAVIAGVLSAEKRNIAEYQVTVRAYEEDSRGMARDVGYGLIRSAEKRLADILLEADLGLVDVAWQRKQDKRTAIDALQAEKAVKIKTLADVRESLTAEPADGEGE